MEGFPGGRFQGHVSAAASGPDDPVRRPHSVTGADIWCGEVARAGAEGVKECLSGEVSGVGFLGGVELTEVDEASASPDLR